MAMRNKMASAVLGCVLGTTLVGVSMPALAGEAGAFIGGVFATKLVGGMRDRNEYEERQAQAAEQMAAQQRAAPAPAPASSSAEQQLSELKSMHAKGLITTEEYNAKKKQVLDSM